MSIGRTRPIRRLTLLLSLAGATLLASSAVVMAQHESTSPTASESGSAAPKTPTAVIPDQYIVVLKDDDAARSSEQATNSRARRGGQDPNQVANEQAQRHGLKVRNVYQNTIKGYSAVIPEGELQEVEDDPRVAFVEPDKEIKATRNKKRKKRSRTTSATSQTLPWGIKKIAADTSSTKAGDGSGEVSNINAYIIDTGIGTHGDLNVTSRAAFNATKDGKNYDCNGHGTHVAGTVAAKDNTSAVVGAAPATPLTGVKVLGCDGSGTTSGVIAGVDWVTAHATKPAMANMSLGGGASSALDLAVQKSADSGIFYAVAAGNDGKDACTKSPARAGAGTDNGILTVAATNSNDGEASFSNYGKCVDIWAPGTNVLSTKMGGGTTTMSGTSMASPHVGGAGALYLSKNTSASPIAVEKQLKTDSVSTSTNSKDGRAIKRLYAGEY
jgi:subtilisin family serine protease